MKLSKKASLWIVIASVVAAEVAFCIKEWESIKRETNRITLNYKVKDELEEGRAYIDQSFAHSRAAKEATEAGNRDEAIKEYKLAQVCIEKGQYSLWEARDKAKGNEEFRNYISAEVNFLQVHIEQLNRAIKDLEKSE